MASRAGTSFLRMETIFPLRKSTSSSFSSDSKSSDNCTTCARVGLLSPRSILLSRDGAIANSAASCRINRFLALRRTRINSPNVFVVLVYFTRKEHGNHRPRVFIVFFIHVIIITVRIFQRVSAIIETFFNGFLIVRGQIDGD